LAPFFFRQRTILVPFRIVPQGLQLASVLPHNVFTPFPGLLPLVWGVFFAAIRFSVGAVSLSLFSTFKSGARSLFSTAVGCAHTPLFWTTCLYGRWLWTPVSCFPYHFIVNSLAFLRQPSIGLSIASLFYHRVSTSLPFCGPKRSAISPQSNGHTLLHFCSLPTFPPGGLPLLEIVPYRNEVDALSQRVPFMLRRCFRCRA